MTYRGAFSHALLVVVTATLVLAAGIAGAAKLNSQNLTQQVIDAEILAR
jgi:hypothetical protein